MDNAHLSYILNSLYNQSLSVDEALTQLKDLPFKDLGFARSIIIVPSGKGIPK